MSIIEEYKYIVLDFIARLQTQGVVYYYALWGIAIALIFLALLIFAKTDNFFLKALAVLAIIGIGFTLFVATKGGV